MTRAPRTRWTGWALLGTFALVWTILCGERGFFPMRQSVVFDGADRILSGQVPFEDFVAPTGPIPYVLQAAVFQVLGVHSFAYLLTAGLMNVAAAFLAVVILRRLFPGEQEMAWVAGLLTAIWFLPQVGTPWVDHVAFLFVLLAVAFGLRVVAGRCDGGAPSLVAAGVCVALGVLSRQSAGLLGLPLMWLLLLLGGYAPRVRPAARMGWFHAGFGATAGAFALWLVGFAELELFVRHFWSVPVVAAMENLGEGWAELVLGFLIGTGPAVVRVALVLAGACAVLVTALLAVGTITGAQPAREAWPPCVLCVSMLGYQYAFGALGGGPPELALPFLGIVLPLGARCVEFALIISRPRMAVLRFCATLLLVLVMGSGLRSAWTRRVYGIFRNSEFPAYCDIDGFGAIRWGRPTSLFGVFDFEPETLTSLVNELRKTDKRFFVFPDFVFLYGLVGRPAPQPLLWFEPGVTYPAGDRAATDAWIVECLRRNNVEIVLLEDASVLGTLERLEHFPKLAEFLAAEFEPRDRLGLFWIWSKKGT